MQKAITEAAVELIPKTLLPHQHANSHKNLRSCATGLLVVELRGLMRCPLARKGTERLVRHGKFTPWAQQFWISMARAAVTGIKLPEIWGTGQHLR